MLNDMGNNKHHSQFKSANGGNQKPSVVEVPQKVETSVSESSAQASLEMYESTKGKPQLYQSEEAAEQAKLDSVKPSFLDNEVAPAMVNADVPEEVPVVHVQRVQELNKMVMVKPLRTETRVRYGNNWYSFELGKKCLVPKHLAQHLEEKGMI